MIAMCDAVRPMLNEVPQALHPGEVRTQRLAVDIPLGGKVKLCSTYKELSQYVMADPATAH